MKFSSSIEGKGWIFQTRSSMRGRVPRRRRTLEVEGFLYDRKKDRHKRESL